MLCYDAWMFNNGTLTYKYHQQCYGKDVKAVESEMEGLWKWRLSRPILPDVVVEYNMTVEVLNGECRQQVWAL